MILYKTYTSGLVHYVSLFVIISSYFRGVMQSLQSLLIDVKLKIVSG